MTWFNVVDFLEGSLPFVKNLSLGISKVYDTHPICSEGYTHHTSASLYIHTCLLDRC